MKNNTAFFNKIPASFKIWFILCAFMSIGMTAVIVWAIIKIVNHFVK